MNKPLPHLFTFLSVLCLLVPAYAAEGGWGEGTPRSDSGRTSSSATTRAFPQRDWSATSAAAPLENPLSSAFSTPDLREGRETPPASSPKRNVWGSNPSLSETQPKLDRLLQENEELRRSLAQNAAAGAAPRAELFDPQAHPVLSIGWVNLLNGYPDPTSTNYDRKNRQYYDASTGIFPPKQPSSNSLKNQVGPEVKTWELQTRTAREAYMAAYQDWQHKQKRYLRKLGEDLAHATQQLGTLTDSLLVSSPQNSGKASMEETGKESRKAEILQRAKIDADNAEHTFKKLQKLLVAAHPTECKTMGDERQLIFLTPEEFERRFIWGFVEKPLTTSYKTLPGQRNDPKNVKGFLLTDPMDIRIGTHMLSWMIPHLEREYNILVDIRTRYKRDFAPKVSGGFLGGILSPAKWSDWHYSTSADLLKDGLKRDYPPFSIAYFPEPKTDQEETLRLLRRDNLGLKLGSKYLDYIKRYQEVESGDLSESFLKVYRGADKATEINMQTTYLNPTRTFPKSLLTPFLSIQTRLQSDPVDKDRLFPDTVVPFIIPRKAQMAAEYVSPKAMGFHRNLWPSVMRELLAQHRTVLKTSSFGLDGATEYAKLYGRYESLVKEISLYLKPLQTADSYSIPSPFEFFFTTSLPPKQLAPEAVVDLAERVIIDRDLTHLRLLPGSKSEPVLHRYIKISLENNKLQSPNPTVFGPNLTSLNVGRNQLRDLEFAVPLTRLTELDVSGQFLSDLSPFGNEDVMPLPNLEKFILAHTGLSQIAPLARFSSLRVLDLSENNIVTVAPLKDLRTLEELNLAQNRIMDMTDLESLYKLRKLDVSSNPVKNLKSIVKLEALQVLIANQCGFTGNWSTILPVAINDVDPRPKALTHLLLKGNEKLIWLPYQTKKSYSSSEVKGNDSALNTSFPGLQVLEVGTKAKLEATVDKPISLSALDRK